MTTSRDEVFVPRKGKLVLGLLVCLAFVAGGAWIVSRSESSEERFRGYACIVFFGVGALVTLFQFAPASSFLRLSPEGMTVRTIWRTNFYRWADIERFGVAEFTASQGGIWQRQRMVGFDFSASYPGRGKGRRVKSINRDLTGFEAALPDTYGWDHTELAAHLNRMRGEFAGSQEPTQVT